MKVGVDTLGYSRTSLRDDDGRNSVPLGFKTSLAFALLLTLATFGCNRVETITTSQFNSVQWESRMKAPELTEGEFTRLYAQAVAADLTNAQIQIVGRRHLNVRLADGGSLQVFLDNAWAEASKDPEHRAELCRRYLAALQASPTVSGNSAAPPDTNSLVAVIRDQRFLEQFKGLHGTSNAIVSEPLVADIQVVYACDTEHGIAYLTEGQRKELGVPFAALRTLALTNLRRILPPLQRLGSGPVFALKADGNYESSLLLSDKLWADQATAVQGDLVAAVPARDVLLFTGSNSQEGLERLRQVVEETYNGGAHVISKTLLVRRSGRWEKLGD